MILFLTYEREGAAEIHRNFGLHPPPQMSFWAITLRISDYLLLTLPLQAGHHQDFHRQFR